MRNIYIYKLLLFLTVHVNSMEKDSNRQDTYNTISMGLDPFTKVEIKKEEKDGYFNNSSKKLIKDSIKTLPERLKMEERDILNYIIHRCINFSFNKDFKQIRERDEVCYKILSKEIKVQLGIYLNMYPEDIKAYVLDFNHNTELYINMKNFLIEDMGNRYRNNFINENLELSKEYLRPLDENLKTYLKENLLKTSSIEKQDLKIINETKKFTKILLDESKKIKDGFYFPFDLDFSSERHLEDFLDYKNKKRKNTVLYHELFTLIYNAQIGEIGKEYSAQKILDALKKNFSKKNTSPKEDPSLKNTSPKEDQSLGTEYEQDSEIEKIEKLIGEIMYNYNQEVVNLVENMKPENIDTLKKELEETQETFQLFINNNIKNNIPMIKNAFIKKAQELIEKKDKLELTHQESLYIELYKKEQEKWESFALEGYLTERKNIIKNINECLYTVNCYNNKIFKTKDKKNELYIFQSRINRKLFPIQYPTESSEAMVCMERVNFFVQNNKKDILEPIKGTCSTHPSSVLNFYKEKYENAFIKNDFNQLNLNMKNLCTKVNTQIDIINQKDESFKKNLNNKKKLYESKITKEITFIKKNEHSKFNGKSIYINN